MAETQDQGPIGPIGQAGPARIASLLSDASPPVSPQPSGVRFSLRACFGLMGIAAVFWAIVHATGGSVAMATAALLILVGIAFDRHLTNGGRVALVLLAWYIAGLSLR